MSANVSFMASAHGMVPWHRTNYVTVQDAMTSEEALRLAKLDFDVLQENVYDNQGIQVPGYRLNFKSDDRKLLGLVTSRYKVIQNREAFAFTDALIGPSCRYETAGSLNGYRTVWMLAQLEPRTIMGDNFKNYLCFVNSFDGSSAMHVCITPIRVVCQNTLNLALRKARRKFSISHLGNIENKLQEADKTLKLSEEYFTEVQEKYMELAKKKVTDTMFQSFLQQLFPIEEDDKESTKKLQQKKQDAVRKAYEVDDLANFTGTAYGVINAVSDMAAHYEPSRITDGYYGNLFSKVIEGHPYLDKAYALVEAM